MRRCSPLHAIDSFSCPSYESNSAQLRFSPWKELPKFINSGMSLIFSILSIFSLPRFFYHFTFFLRKSGLMSSPQKWPIPWSNQTRHQHVKAPVDGVRSMPSTSCHCFPPSFVMLKSGRLKLLLSCWTESFHQKISSQDILEVNRQTTSWHKRNVEQSKKNTSRKTPQ